MQEASLRAIRTVIILILGVCFCALASVFITKDSEKLETYLDSKMERHRITMPLNRISRQHALGILGTETYSTRIGRLLAGVDRHFFCKINESNPALWKGISPFFCYKGLTAHENQTYSNNSSSNERIAFEHKSEIQNSHFNASMFETDITHVAAESNHVISTTPPVLVEFANFQTSSKATPLPIGLTPEYTSIAFMVHISAQQSSIASGLSTTQPSYPATAQPTSTTASRVSTSIPRALSTAVAHRRPTSVLLCRTAAAEPDECVAIDPCGPCAGCHNVDGACLQRAPGECTLKGRGLLGACHTCELRHARIPAGAFARFYGLAVGDAWPDQNRSCSAAAAAGWAAAGLGGASPVALLQALDGPTDGLAALGAPACAVFVGVHDRPALCGAR